MHQARCARFVAHAGPDQHGVDAIGQRVKAGQGVEAEAIGIVLGQADHTRLGHRQRHQLGDAGAVVIGPAGTVKDALAFIGSEQHLDGAVLDVSLRGDFIFPAADILIERGVPFVFTTGYDASIMPSRFQHVVRCEKPVNIRKITQALGRVIDAEVLSRR